MGEDDKQGEALKALGDWSKWLISIETALIAGMIAVINTKPEIMQGEMAGVMKVAGASFGISIVFATLLLGAIPNAMQEVPILKDGKRDVHSYKHFDLIPLRGHAAIQHIGFLVGLGSLLYSISKGVV
jgi:hypothetical protein